MGAGESYGNSGVVGKQVRGSKREGPGKGIFIMTKKKKKKKQYTNKTGEMLFDYVKTNREYTEENRRRQEEEGVRTQGLKNLNTMEKTCVVVIVLGIIGIIIKYVIL